MDLYLKIKAGYRHPRSVPIISPSKEFDANVKKTFDKGMILYNFSLISNILTMFFFSSLHFPKRTSKQILGSWPQLEKIYQTQKR